MSKFSKRNILLMAVLFITQPFLHAQTLDDSININRTREIMEVLAGDSLRGRGNLSSDLQKAGEFVAGHFKRIGLIPFPNMLSFYIPFPVYLKDKPVVADSLILNGKEISTEHFFYLHPDPGAYPTKNLDDFFLVELESFITEDIAKKLIGKGKNILVWTKKLQPDNLHIFPNKFDIPAMGIDYNLLMVYSAERPVSLQLFAGIEYYKNIEYNVVAMLPGKTLPQEVILFSSHYDHVGVMKGADSIWNGANDNASGTTALLMLAEYFHSRNDNDRTLVFCAFAGEEIGLIGSHEFSNYIKPAKIIAGINLEMLGVPQYGKRKVFITGQYESSLPAILSKALRSVGVKVVREPDPERLLFQRSDNYPFVKKGVPAHTIMASNDEDKCYHQPCDDLRHIDFKNLNFLIQAIARASIHLIDGTVTPTRISNKQ